MEQWNPRDMHKLKAKQILAKDANHCYYFLGQKTLKLLKLEKNVLYLERGRRMCVDEQSLQPIHILEMEQDFAFRLSSRFMKVYDWPIYDESISYI